MEPISGPGTFAVRDLDMTVAHGQASQGTRRWEGAKPALIVGLGRSGRGHHPTAFDIEMPHSVGVALAIAGHGNIRHAQLTDMMFGDVMLPRLGGVWLGPRSRKRGMHGILSVRIGHAMPHRS